MSKRELQFECEGRLSYRAWTGSTQQSSPQGAVHIHLPLEQLLYDDCHECYLKQARLSHVRSTSARGLVGYAGYAKESALVAAVAGLVNGSGSMGAVLQGMLTTQILNLAGWAGLFGTLGCAMLGSAIALGPAVAIESEGLRNSKTA